jgi:hypothetical protein
MHYKTFEEYIVTLFDKPNNGRLLYIHCDSFNDLLVWCANYWDHNIPWLNDTLDEIKQNLLHEEILIMQIISRRNKIIIYSLSRYIDTHYLKQKAFISIIIEEHVWLYLEKLLVKLRDKDIPFNYISYKSEKLLSCGTTPPKRTCIRKYLNDDRDYAGYTREYYYPYSMPVFYKCFLYQKDKNLIGVDMWSDNDIKFEKFLNIISIE